MVCDPVHDDFHSEAVRLAYKTLEVLKGSVLRMNLLEVLDAVWRAYGLLLSLLADRHEPDHIHTEVLDVLQTC